MPAAPDVTKCHAVLARLRRSLSLAIHCSEPGKPPAVVKVLVDEENKLEDIVNAWASTLHAFSGKLPVEASITGVPGVGLDLSRSIRKLRKHLPLTKDGVTVFVALPAAKTEEKPEKPERRREPAAQEPKEKRQRVEAKKEKSKDAKKAEKLEKGPQKSQDKDEGLELAKVETEAQAKPVESQELQGKEATAEATEAKATEATEVKEAKEVKVEAKETDLQKEEVKTKKGKGNGKGKGRTVKVKPEKVAKRGPQDGHSDSSDSEDAAEIFFRQIMAEPDSP